MLRIPEIYPTTNKRRKLQITFYIATYNVETLSSDEKLEEIRNKLKNLKWDITELGEGRRTNKL